MFEHTIGQNAVGAGLVRRWLGTIVITMLACAIAGAQPNSPSPSKRSAETILSDPTLWGKDFPLAVASLQSWPVSGERSVVIFKDRIVGGTPLKTRDEAEQTSKKVAAAMASQEFKPKAGFQAMFENVPKRATSLKVEIMPRFSDDDSVRVASTRPNAQFLAPNLTVAVVQQRLGTPEKVEQQVIQSEGDRRPVILTLYRYADGGIAFAESDVAARPGLVDRVVLNAPVVVKAIEAQ